MNLAIPRLKVGVVFAAVVMLLTAHPAAAQTIITDGGGGNPDENILFQGTATGTTVFGVTNNTGAQVQFDTNGTGQVISGESSSGQARLEPFGAATFGALGISLADPTFDAFNDLKFNIDAAQDGTFRLTAFGSFGQQSTILGLTGNGSNVYRIETIGGNTLSRVLLESLGGNNFVDVAQVRIGGVQDTGTITDVVPEPGSLALAAGGVLPLAGLIRRRVRRR